MKHNLARKDAGMMRFEFSIMQEEKKHFHDDIKLLYVFEGEVDLYVEEDRYLLKKDDFIHGSLDPAPDQQEWYFEFWRDEGVGQNVDKPEFG